jgi:putative addiction module component (TIGR02574 family)
MSIEELKDEALRLSPEGRAYLARELLASLDKMSEAEIEELWLQEAMRRDEEVSNGTAQSRPADEVFSRARARRK